jgi:hypothetical protein
MSTTLDMISVFSLFHLSCGSKELLSVYSSVGIPGNLQWIQSTQIKTRKWPTNQRAQKTGNGCRLLSNAN